MTPSAGAYPERALLERLLRRYAPVRLPAATDHLAPGDREAIGHLVEAARWIDRIYWRQRSEHGWLLKQQLTASPLDAPAELERLLNLGFGPWDVFDNDRPFWGGATRPPGGSLYPADLTREELQEYLDRHPQHRFGILSPVTQIQRDGEQLVAVPYAEVFRDELAHVARALMAASRHVSDARFATFLSARAQDLQQGTLAESDALWIDAGQSPIDIAIGPYEVYDDGMFGVKASYEATVMVRHPMTDRLDEVERLGAGLAAVLPGAVAPRHERQRIVVGIYDVLYAAGGTNIGAKAIAAMLPNDERVRSEHGSRLLLFRNVIAAKFEPILKPIGERVLRSDQAAQVDEDAFVLHTLLHELAHALIAAPADGSDAPGTANQRLLDRYSTIEECRADLVGLVFLEHLIERGLFARELRPHAAMTFIASSFRVLRFGRGDDYGVAATIILNQLMRHDAIRRDGTRFAVDVDATLAAARGLATRVQQIATAGSYADAGALLEDLGTLPREVEEVLTRLEDLPVDLEFSFDTSFLL